MKLIKPYFEIIEQQSGLEGMYKQIELCGRVAYKSEDKITEDSYKGFVDRMIKLNHGAVLEHGTVYLKIPLFYVARAYINNKYSIVNIEYSNKSYTIKSETGLEEFPENIGFYYVTTNMRVLIETNRLDDLKYLCKPTEYHERRVCVRFVCDRGVSHKKFVA